MNEGIILFGTGAILDSYLSLLEYEKNFIIYEIWDNSERKQGSIIKINDKSYKVIAPHVIDKGTCVVIMSTVYEKEMKQQLQQQLNILEKQIKNSNYLYKYIEVEMLKKYDCKHDFDIYHAMQCISQNGLDIFNSFEMRDKMEFETIISRDESNGLLYTFWNNKKLFFKKKYDTAEKARRYIEGIKREQNINSPHCYTQNGFEPDKDDVVVDVGAAEGFFALDCVENVKKIFLIEGDQEWIEALQYTFQPYKEKVVIIPKLVGNIDDDTFVTLDTINQTEKITYVKMDIEGYEEDALHGAKELLNSNDNIRMIICTYHRSNSAKEISTILLEHKFHVHFSRGYMFFNQIDIKPELRHSVVFARKKKLSRIFMWGCGKNAKDLIGLLDNEKCIVKGIVDNDVSKQGKEWNNSGMVCNAKRLVEESYDFIFITPQQSSDIIRWCEQNKIDSEKILLFTKEDCLKCDFLDSQKVKEYYLEKELKQYKIKIENFQYESGKKEVPRIKSAIELLNRIEKEQLSLAWFGDGEFETMFGNKRPWFQEPNLALAKKLKETLNSRRKNLLLAVADNFASLEKYTEQAANDIRNYLSDGKREMIMHNLDMNYTYYDAYVTRPYMIYKDKNLSKSIFDKFKAIWTKRDVLIVEGKYSRFGVNNDLLDGAKTVKRIVVPDKNAFNVYFDILNEVKKQCKDKKNTLVLASAGPTATVLAYDLSILEIQTLDIGQLDNEYEWYLRGVQKRIPIPGKTVSEFCRGFIFENCELKDYYNQIVCEINNEEDD